MNRLVSTISRLVCEHIELSKNVGEVRLIFHGPPLEILHSVFLEVSGSIDSVPTLLLLPKLDEGESNPPIGVSGKCDDTHLLDLRNSPTEPAFLALVAPGLHNIRSITSTADEFGISPECNGANVHFVDWWEDSFVQSLIERAFELAGLKDDQLDDARELAKQAAQAIDDMDPDRSRRLNVWQFVSRLYSAVDTPADMSIAMRLSLAFGVPPTEDGKFSLREQSSTISKIAELMADGFTAGIGRLTPDATETDLVRLSDFQTHLSIACDVPTMFERSIQYFYGPSRGFQLQPAPNWWTHLTCSKWNELLAEDTTEQATFELSCTNPLVDLPRGMPVVVEKDVHVNISAPNRTYTGAVFALNRGKTSILLTSTESNQLIGNDVDVPSHKTPLRYVASADGFKPAAIKVISLEHWLPGIFVACRQAKKLSPPRKPTGRGSGLPDFETALTVPGKGRYELLVFVASQINLHSTATGCSADGGDSNQKDSITLTIEGENSTNRRFIQIDADGNYRVDLEFDRVDSSGKLSHQKMCINITVEDVPEQGCRGVLERLIISNRRKVESSEKPVVRINRNELSTTLQDWIISAEAVSQSFQPVVLGDDFEDAWTRKQWGTGKGPTFSRATFLHDPRPDFEEFNPPLEFLDARKKIAAHVRGKDNNSLFELADLGLWYDREPDFATAVEQYVDSYTRWLISDPDVAAWVDVVLVCSVDVDGRTISRIPDAILLSPMHPARVGWHVIAQRVLREADDMGRPCPAVSVFDPDCIPDLLTLRVRAPGGSDNIRFLSVENSTDYWSVLWNGDRLAELPQRSAKAPFGPSFGISVGGISASFTAGQVIRALDDVSGLLSAKPRISLVVDGTDGTSNSCNEGIVLWGNSQFGAGWEKKQLAPSGPRSLDVFDYRGINQRPDDATIANLSHNTQNRVRWFIRQPQYTTPDLGILSQIDMAEPKASEVEGRSPIGYGGLLRHRIRRQLPASFMNETRQSVQTGLFEDAFANKVVNCISTLESLGEQRVGIRFAPNVTAIRSMLEERDAEYVATSSAAVDPAAFLGGWLEEAYLWDYDLPSYSRRSGDTNGYYLLSKVKAADLDALTRSVSRLSGCHGMDRDQTKDMLHEIARRGIPTVRGMSGEDTDSTGDLGVFVAARLLQDKFRLSGSFDSLVPILNGVGESNTSICLIVPVDPFKCYIDDLTKSVTWLPRNSSLSRPDLISIGVLIDGDNVRIHVTPIEVKCYPEGTFRDPDSALDQARNLSRLLSALLPHKDQPVAWALGFQHLLLSIVNFGMRVYSQNGKISENEALWSRLHERIASAILSPVDCVTVDNRGRLVIVDYNRRSIVRDFDGDGFCETVNLSAEDAGHIVSGDPTDIYGFIRARINDWELLPRATWTVSETDPAEIHGTVIDSGNESSAFVDNFNSSKQIVIAVNPDTGSSTVSEPIAGNFGNLYGAEDHGVERNKSYDTHVDKRQRTSGINIALGDTIDSFQSRTLNLNISDTRLNQLNMGVVGDLGTGKTQLLKSLMYQIATSSSDNRGMRPRFLIFDYKRDYSSKEFVEATGAKVVVPHRLPLNLFDTSGMGQSFVPWLDRFRFFTDVLDKIYSGIGPVQRAKLKVAVETAYRSCRSGQQPTLLDIHSAYAKILDGKSDSPMSIIDDLVDMEVFSANHSDTIPFNEFFDGVVVISLDAFGQDDRSKNMLVAVMLNMFYENMLKIEKKPFLGQNPQLRAIDSFLLVDEADNIMKYEFDVLRKLLLQGREFGTGVILASQYLRHFKVNSTDYREPLLSWFIHKVPNITQNELSALGISGPVAELTERIRNLEVHECLYKSHDVSGEFIRGMPFFEMKDRNNQNAH